MRPKYLFFLSFFVLLKSGFSMNGNAPEGSRSAAMGGASVAVSDFWSLQNNQAGLAFFNRAAAGAYIENRFLVRELSLSSAGAVVPVNSGVFGVKVSYFGYELYNESKIGLAYARRLSEKFAVGVQLDYLHTAFGLDYGKKGVVTFELGLMSKINDQLSIGFHAFNPVSAKISEVGDERVPAILRLGAAYTFNDDLMITGEVEKNMDFAPTPKFGIEYQVVNGVFVRGGISTSPAIYSFGFGVNLGNLTLDFSSGVHQILGYSPQFSMIYHFK
jgi:hypothetical protein